MSFLSDAELLDLVERRQLIIDPFTPQLVGPSSISLCLGDWGYRLKGTGAVDVASEETYPALVRVMPDRENRLALPPGEVLLAPTFEKIALSPNLAGLLDGTSDLARLGVSTVLSSHVAPGFGWPHPGVLTLEIVSHYSEVIYLRPRMRICKMLFVRLAQQPSRLHQDPFLYYSGQQDVAGSQLFRKLYLLGDE